MAVIILRGVSWAGPTTQQETKLDNPNEPMTPELIQTMANRIEIQAIEGIQQHQLLSFLLLTFGWSWGSFVIISRPLGWAGMRRAQVLFAWGPLIGAAIVTWLVGNDVRAWVAQVDPRDIELRWYLLALTIPLLLTDGSRVLVWLAGGPVNVADVSPGEFATAFLTTLLLAGSLEEFGWRGFAQSHLQQNRSALLGALIIGIVWALWHLPLAYEGAGAGYDAGEFVGLLLGLPMFSVVMAWLYNSTGGRLFPVLLFHAMINAPSPLTVEGSVSDLLELIGGVGQLAILLLVPLIILWVYGPDLLADGHQ